MLLNLHYYGDSVLREKGKPILEINDEIRELVKNMEETMHEAAGIGIAAPQIGESLALFITAVPEGDGKQETEELPQTRVFINPKILSYSEESWDYQEGCLSIPGIRESVTRPCKIRIEATDLEGNIFQEELAMLAARVFMHENDHINGVLFVDRLPKVKRKQIDATLRKIKNKYRQK